VVSSRKDRHRNRYNAIKAKIFYYTKKFIALKKPDPKSEKID
jgi:hypothetical protein